MFVDDKQIFETKSKKCYGFYPKTIIEIEVLDKMTLHAIYEKIFPHEVIMLMDIAERLVEFKKAHSTIPAGNAEALNKLQPILTELSEFHEILKKVNKASQCTK